MLGFRQILKILLKFQKQKIKIISDNCESMGTKFDNKFINELVDVEILV